MKIKEKGLFGILSRQLMIHQSHQLPSLGHQGSTAYMRGPISTGRRDSEPSVLRPEAYDFFISEVGLDRRVDSQTCTLGSASTA